MEDAQAKWSEWVAAKVAAKAVNSLGIELLGITSKQGKNTLLSPYSIQSVMVMVYAGAKGGTRDELQRVLHYPDTEEEVHKAFVCLQKQLQQMVEKCREWAIPFPDGVVEDPLTVNLVNRLYSQCGFNFRQEFLYLLSKNYGAELEELDFSKNSEGSAKVINQWVEENTHRKIKNIISPRVLTELTRLVLVNAIYLKARWSRKFSEEATQPRPFYLLDSGPVEVPTMETLAAYGYAEREDFRIVSLPYFGGDLQFVVLLPKTQGGLPEMEGKVTEDVLSECRNLKARLIKLFMPKFELKDMRMSLTEAMQNLGVKQVFDMPKGSADLGGMAPRKGDDYLALSEVLHQTYLKVDEQGSEAAAATVAVAVAAGIGPREEPIEVRVDRPFLFAIQHKASGACLFMGRMVDPR